VEKRQKENRANVARVTNRKRLEDDLEAYRDERARELGLI
jgi:hypothetical protein